MTFFSRRPFYCFNVVFSVGGANPYPHRYGGAKILTFQQIHNVIITISAPEGGQTPLTTSMGGMAGFPPLDPPLNPKFCFDSCSVSRLYSSFIKHLYFCLQTILANYNIIMCPLPAISVRPLRSLDYNGLLVHRSITSTSPQCAFASVGPLLRNCLSAKVRAQILSPSSFSVPCLLKSFLSPGHFPQVAPLISLNCERRRIFIRE